MKKLENYENNSIFTSKSNVLKFLQKNGKTFSIEKLFDFTVDDWKSKKIFVLSSIQKLFSDKVVVRSSAKNEDSPQFSNAGTYETILNVSPKSKKEIINSIENVITSYEKNGNFDDSNQVIIQNQSQNIVSSGVLFTKTSDSGLPYYVINFEDGSSTDSVTKGLVSNSLKIFRDIDPCKIPKKWKKLIFAVIEIEKITKTSFLDIEFGLTKSGKVIIFQARPITTVKPIDFKKRLKLKQTISSGQKNYRRFKKKKSIVPTIFSDMTDWNPAEIIGNSPNPLDYSLYDFLIMKKVWKQGRTEIGYKKSGENSLMVKFGNKPYVDVEASFMSLIPETLSDKLTKKLLKFYLVKLKNNPQLHDKAEFKILLTCFDLSIDSKLRELEKNGFSRKETIEIKKILLDFTNTIVKDFHQISLKAKNNIDELEYKRIQIKKINNSSDPNLLLNSSYELLTNCKTFGTIPFSTIARIAFISSSIFHSAKNMKIIDESFFNNFLSNVSTPLSEIRRDVSLLGNKKLSKKSFLKKYGHLRPGTYDITMPRYDGNNTFFKKINFKTEHVSRQKLSKNPHLDYVLSKNFLEFYNISFLEFLENSLVLREKLKFEFTKSLSDAIENIAQAGKILGFSRTDLSYLDIQTIFKTKNLQKNDILKIWNKKIKKEKSKFLQNNFLILPPLVMSENDFELISHFTTQPNYITDNSLTGNIFDLSNFKTNDNLKGKIVLIENADPGYDWIFTKNPLGLITKYGGVASHMAIRCSEIGLPAAIGVGEILFEKLKFSTKILLDCKNSEILSLENQQNDEETEVRKTLKSLGYIK